MSLLPTYLRVVVTARCSLACSYCHMEGDPAGGAAGGMSTAELHALLESACNNGIRKLKFLGGEPLLRGDLPEVIARLRAGHPDLDISLITGGAVPLSRLDACFDAGLTRANLSIHGWSAGAFAERTQRGEGARGLRQAVLNRLVERGRFLKLNYVWRGPDDDTDLALLLEWAAGQPVVVGVLDDLGQADLGPAAIRATLLRLRGAPAQVHAEPDPDSLPTLRLSWDDGLRCEVKDQHLGAIAPWASCQGCPVRAQCREGIHALRLTHDGLLRPCMDRPDVSVDLRGVLRAAGSVATTALWATRVRSWVRPASTPTLEAA